MNFCVTRPWRRGTERRVGGRGAGVPGPAHSLVWRLCNSRFGRTQPGRFSAVEASQPARARGGRWEEAESAQLPQPHSRFGHRRRKEPPASTDGDGRKRHFARFCHALKPVPETWKRGQPLSRRPSIFGWFSFFFLAPRCGRRIAASISAAGRRKSGSGSTEVRSSRRERVMFGAVMVPVIRSKRGGSSGGRRYAVRGDLKPPSAAEQRSVGRFGGSRSRRGAACQVSHR